MNEFKHRCRRRFDVDGRQVWAGSSPCVVNNEGLSGAGSGGSAGPQVYGSQSVYFKGLWGVAAGQVKLFAECRTLQGDASLTDYCPEMYLVASDGDVSGNLYIRGANSTRITSGPGKTPKVESSDEVGGVEIQAGDDQNVTIMRGMDPWVADQKIYMTKNLISVHTGEGKVMIDAGEAIYLTCGGCRIALKTDVVDGDEMELRCGSSFISIRDEAIVISGEKVNIN